jgi:methyltransferase (TIGR00027 family)
LHSGKPSKTALAAAHHRAAHQVLEQGRIFSDPFAIRILGDTPESIANEAVQHPSRTRMRFFIAVRTRLAEEALASAVERGVRQLVVLGAGLDTFAYRSPYREALRIFEADHPHTQIWKREALANAAISVPSWLTFAAVDFEKQTLVQGLEAAAFDRTQPTFFTWLGVVPYLTEQAIWSTLTFISSLPNESQVVFDYGDLPESLSPEIRARHDALAERVANLGEAWLTFFDEDELHAQLRTLGFSDIDDWGPQRIAARFFPARSHTAPAKGGHIIRAAKAVS